MHQIYSLSLFLWLFCFGFFIIMIHLILMLIIITTYAHLLNIYFYTVFVSHNLFFFLMLLFWFWFCRFHFWLSIYRFGKPLICTQDVFSLVFFSFCLHTYTVTFAIYLPGRCGSGDPFLFVQIGGVCCFIVI